MARLPRPPRAADPARRPALRPLRPRRRLGRGPRVAGRVACRVAHRAARVALPAALQLAALAALLLPAGLPARADAPDRYAGTYRIESWRELEARGLHHFFYLQPDGHFLLAAEWPGNEHSQFVGTWSVTADRLYLNGQGRVDTNQGAWRTEFHRTYRIRVEPGGFVLAPEPQKNRYGLLGWPQDYRYYRRQPAPNLPGVALPADAGAMAAHIAALLAARP
jgi:hypothetical protein